jgi:hypothetical protein
MPISVLYVNNTYGMIKRKLLEACIVSGSITKFFRSSGWVTIGVDPIRKTNHGHLGERREIATCQYRDKLDKVDTLIMECYLSARSRWTCE